MAGSARASMPCLVGTPDQSGVRPGLIDEALPKSPGDKSPGDFGQPMIMVLLKEIPLKTSVV